ncbi:hypothetical protein N9053_01600 [bacterium]|nr:hypothetical protein [bacterium]
MPCSYPLQRLKEEHHRDSSTSLFFRRGTEEDKMHLSAGRLVPMSYHAERIFSNQGVSVRQHPETEQVIHTQKIPQLDRSNPLFA